MKQILRLMSTSRLYNWIFLSANHFQWMFSQNDFYPRCVHVQESWSQVSGRQKTIKLVKSRYWLSCHWDCSRVFVTCCLIVTWYRVCRGNCHIIVCISSWLLLNRLEPEHSLTDIAWSSSLTLSPLIHTISVLYLHSVIILIPSSMFNFKIYSY